MEIAYEVVKTFGAVIAGIGQIFLVAPILIVFAVFGFIKWKLAK